VNYDYRKLKPQHFSAVLAGLSVLLAILIVLKLISLAEASVHLEKLTRDATKQSNAEDLQAALEPSKQRADALKKKNMFMPPPPKPQPPMVSGILGEKAFINGKWYKVGQTAAQAKILVIDAASVTIDWQGKEKVLTPMSMPSASKTSQPAAKSPQRPGRKAFRR